MTKITKMKKRTKNKQGRIFIALGTLLLLAAVLLALWNIIDGVRAEKESVRILHEFRKTMAENAGSRDAVSADGREYIGIVAIPELGVELPVCSEMNDAALRSSACRYHGSLEGRDIVICARNYGTFFRRLNDLAAGDRIFFTTVSGDVHEFEVSWNELITGADSDSAAMTENSDSWDITLFSRTWSGRQKVTVRAEEV